MALAAQAGSGCRNERDQGPGRVRPALQRESHGKRYADVRLLEGNVVVQADSIPRGSSSAAALDLARAALAYLRSLTR